MEVLYVSKDLQNNVNGFSMRVSFILTGLGLLLMAIFAGVANSYINKTLLANSDIRLGLLGFILVVILDVIVAWGLYLILKSANHELALLVFVLRLVYASILACSLMPLIQAMNISNGAITAEINTEMFVQVKLFTNYWNMGLIIFGLHLLLLGYLIFVAEYIPKWLGVIVAISSLGYIIDGIGKIISCQYNLSITMFTFIGEVVLLFWLLWKGIFRLKQDGTKVNK
jgi:hypothetical protein